MIALLDNPTTRWLRWIFTKYYLALTNWRKHLHIEYMTEIKNCKFGIYNTIYKYSRLRDTELGNYTYIARNCQIYNTKIGHFTCIGPNVNTGMGAHPTSTFVSSHPLFYSTIGQASKLTIVEKNLFDEYPPTHIGNDVWIGNNVNIMYGVSIGDGAIIGTGAVVTKDIEPYTIVGGVPAKVIRTRFTEEQIAFLKNFKWWEKDLDWLKKNKELFTDIEKFISIHSQH